MHRCIASRFVEAARGRRGFSLILGVYVSVGPVELYYVCMRMRVCMWWGWNEFPVIHSPAINNSELCTPVRAALESDSRRCAKHNRHNQNHIEYFIERLGGYGWTDAAQWFSIYVCLINIWVINVLIRIYLVLGGTWVGLPNIHS